MYQTVLKVEYLPQAPTVDDPNPKPTEDTFTLAPGQAIELVYVVTDDGNVELRRAHTYDQADGGGVIVTE